MNGPRPVSEPDSLTSAWWEATRDERLLLQTCRVCGKRQHYPRPLCTQCGSTTLHYTQASGVGKIYSFTVVHRAPEPAFQPPYVVALIRLDEGPVVLSNVAGADVDDLRCDMEVKVAWEDLPDGRKLPVFVPQASR